MLTEEKRKQGEEAVRKLLSCFNNESMNSLFLAEVIKWQTSPQK